MYWRFSSVTDIRRPFSIHTRPATGRAEKGQDEAFTGAVVVWAGRSVAVGGFLYGHFPVAITLVFPRRPLKHLRPPSLPAYLFTSNFASSIRSGAHGNGAGFGTGTGKHRDFNQIRGKVAKCRNRAPGRTVTRIGGCAPFGFTKVLPAIPRWQSGRFHREHYRQSICCVFPIVWRPGSIAFIS